MNPHKNHQKWETFFKDNVFLEVFLTSYVLKENLIILFNLILKNGSSVKETERNSLHSSGMDIVCQ